MERAEMKPEEQERRRHPRIPLGVPVRVHLADRRAMTLELIEVSAGGGSFRALAERPGLGQRTAFGFVMPDQSICLARGRVIRVESRAFAVELDDMNAAFRGFLGDVSGPNVHAA